MQRPFAVGQEGTHIDKNDYYGGAEAAFSLQEAEEWVKKVNEGLFGIYTFHVPGQY